MLGSDYVAQNCSVARALETVGERWTLLIVRELLRGPRRFSQLERDLDVSKNVLTSRLDKLVALDVARKTPATVERPTHVYELTNKGADLFPVISALMAWGDRYDAPDGPPAVFTHFCGHPADHQLTCTHCGTTVNAGNIQAVPGPGFRPHT